MFFHQLIFFFLPVLLLPPGCQFKNTALVIFYVKYILSPFTQGEMTTVGSAFLPLPYQSQTSITPLFTPGFALLLSSQSLRLFLSLILSLPLPLPLSLHTHKHTHIYTYTFIYIRVSISFISTPTFVYSIHM